MLLFADLPLTMYRAAVIPVVQTTCTTITAPVVSTVTVASPTIRSTQGHPRGRLHPHPPPPTKGWSGEVGDGDPPDIETISTDLTFTMLWSNCLMDMVCLFIVSFKHFHG